MIKNVRKYPNTIVIAGGGIQNIHTLNSYKDIGAANFSVSSLFFHPVKSVVFFNDYYKNLRKS
jgi:phosphoribosylformimino-5-aminoimidazole carboxamide ribonucleotide (ProFAR) isomerase